MLNKTLFSFFIFGFLVTSCSNDENVDPSVPTGPPETSIITELGDRKSDIIKKLNEDFKDLKIKEGTVSEYLIGTLLIGLNVLVGSHPPSVDPCTTDDLLLESGKSDYFESFTYSFSENEKSNSSFNIEIQKIKSVVDNIIFAAYRKSEIGKEYLLQIKINIENTRYKEIRNRDQLRSCVFSRKTQHDKYLVIGVLEAIPSIRFKLQVKGETTSSQGIGFTIDDIGLSPDKYIFNKVEESSFEFSIISSSSETIGYKYYEYEID